MSLKVFDLRCPRCGVEEHDVLLDDARLPDCARCRRVRMVKMPCAQRALVTLTKGRSPESRESYKQEFRERMNKRSADFDKTPRGRAEREGAIYRQMKAGNLPKVGG
jgi:hypothetical protein